MLANKIEFGTLNGNHIVDNVIDTLTLCIDSNSGDVSVRWSESGEDKDMVSVPIDEFESYVDEVDDDDLHNVLATLIPSLDDYRKIAVDNADRFADLETDKHHAKAEVLGFISDVLIGYHTGELTELDAFEMIKLMFVGE